MRGWQSSAVIGGNLFGARSRFPHLGGWLLIPPVSTMDPDIVPVCLPPAYWRHRLVAFIRPLVIPCLRKYSSERDAIQLLASYCRLNEQGFSFNMVPSISLLSYSADLDAHDNGIKQVGKRLFTYRFGKTMNYFKWKLETSSIAFYLC